MKESAQRGFAANKLWRVGFSPREALASLPPYPATSGAEAPRGLKSALQIAVVRVKERSWRGR
jgi:hypothetical protein